MKLYRDSIFTLAQNKTNERFYNTNAEHAEVVHQAIAMYAQKDINIFSGSLCTEISNNSEYCQAMDRFLSSDKSHRVNIILTDFSEDFWKRDIAAVLKKYPAQVCIKTWEGKVVRKDKPVHFTFADGCIFRLETDTENHMTYGNFNSPDEVDSLKKVFTTVFKQAEDVKIA